MAAPATVSIREATSADLEAINGIYNHAVRTSTATWDEVEWSIEKRVTWFEAHRSGTPVLVAECDGECAGFACVSRMSEKSGWRFTSEDTIYLDERFRGRGIGRALLRALLARAKEDGLRAIVASISSDNAVSLALHRSLGFEVVGELTNAGFKFGAWQSTTYLLCDLQRD